MENIQDTIPSTVYEQVKAALDFGEQKVVQYRVVPDFIPPSKILRTGKEIDPAARYKLKSGRTLTRKEANIQKAKAEEKAALKVEKEKNKEKKSKGKAPAATTPELPPIVQDLQIEVPTTGM